MAGRKVKVTPIRDSKWKLRYKDFNNKDNRLVFYGDERAANREAARIEAELQQFRLLGVGQQREALLVQKASRPIAEALESYRLDMAATNGQDHIDSTIREIERAQEFCKWRSLSDIDADSFNRYLQKQRAQKRKNRTIQKYIQATKGFVKWAVREGWLANDVLVSVQKPNPETDRAFDRRHLTQDEVQWLVGCTRVAGNRAGMTGAERAMLYHLAILTGFRQSEIRSLCVGNLHLDEVEPFVTIEAKAAKNRKRANQALPDSRLVEQLRRYIEGKTTGTKLFPTMPSRFKPAGMLRRDMEAARKRWLESFEDGVARKQAERGDFLCVENDKGEIIDFHALRHTFAYLCVSGGATGKELMQLLRVSSFQVVEKYTKSIEAGAGAIRKVAATITPVEFLVATGRSTDESKCHESARIGHVQKRFNDVQCEVDEEPELAVVGGNPWESFENSDSRDEARTRTSFKGNRILSPEVLFSLAQENRDQTSILERLCHESATFAPKTDPTWRVLKVDRAGKEQGVLTDNLGYREAVAYAAGWMSHGSRDSVAVVVPANA